MQELKLACPEASKYLLEYLTGRLEGRPEAETFEAHVHDCEVCKALVKDKRKALQAVIAAVSNEDSAEDVSESPKGIKLVIPKHQLKTLIVGGASIVGLLLVSYAIRPGSNLVGDKIGDSLKQDKPVAASTPSPNFTEELKTRDSISSAQPQNAQPAKPSAPAPQAPPKTASNTAPSVKDTAPAPKIQPKAATSRSITAPSSERKIRRHRAVSPSKTLVEIFDENGNKISETKQSRGD